jgi:hypothetical protein
MILSLSTTSQAQFRTKHGLLIPGSQGHFTAAKLSKVTDAPQYRYCLNYKGLGHYSPSHHLLSFDTLIKYSLQDRLGRISRYRRALSVPSIRPSNAMAANTTHFLSSMMPILTLSYLIRLLSPNTSMLHTPIRRPFFQRELKHCSLHSPVHSR